MAIKKHVLTL